MAENKEAELFGRQSSSDDEEDEESSDESSGEPEQENQQVQVSWNHAFHHTYI